MKRDDIDLAVSALICERIRSLRDTYPNADSALQNWAKWSRDRRGIYPPGVVPPAIWDDAPVSKWSHDEELDYNPYQKLSIQTAEKGDRPEEEDYDEKTAVILDERIHGPGGLSETLRSALEVAYVTRYTPEDRFHRLTNPPCQPDTFRERLAECLAFVSRFA
jgi:hypothetical protein